MSKEIEGVLDEFKDVMLPKLPKIFIRIKWRKFKVEEPNPYVAGPSVWAQPIVLWALKLQPWVGP